MSGVGCFFIFLSLGYNLGRYAYISLLCYFLVKTFGLSAYLTCGTRSGSYALLLLDSPFN